MMIIILTSISLLRALSIYISMFPSPSPSPSPSFTIIIHTCYTTYRLFDAFNGSPTDTFLMILVPLSLTARLVNANVWSYMAFGSLYANWLTLIHAEYVHPWDPYFRNLGLGTAADHHVHHKLFTYNYGHTFMYWDWLFGTYKDPAHVDVFNKGV